MSRRERPPIRWAADDCEYAPTEGLGEVFWGDAGGRMQILIFPPVEVILKWGAASYLQQALSVVISFEQACDADLELPQERELVCIESAELQIEVCRPIPCPAMLNGAVELLKHADALLAKHGLCAQADAVCGYLWGLIHRDVQERKRMIGEKMASTGDQLAAVNTARKWRPDRDIVIKVLSDAAAMTSGKTAAIEKAAKHLGKSRRTLDGVIARMGIADHEWRKKT